MCAELSGWPLQVWNDRATHGCSDGEIGSIVIGVRRTSSCSQEDGELHRARGIPPYKLQPSPSSRGALQVEPVTAVIYNDLDLTIATSSGHTVRVWDGARGELKDTFVFDSASAGEGEGGCGGGEGAYRVVCKQSVWQKSEL